MSPEGRRTLCASRRSRTACQNCTRQSKRMSRFHKSHFPRKFTRKMPPRKTAPQTLCELAQSKRMSRWNNISHRWLWQREKRRRDIKRRQEVERRETLCASLRASQNEPRARTDQNADYISCEPAQWKHMSRFHRSHFIRKLTGKMPQTKTAPQTLCKPARSKRMSRFHKSHFIWKFTGKMPQTKLSAECGRTLCASLPSRNACQDFTRATLYGSLQVKCRRSKPCCRLCASLRSWNACQDFTRATLFIRKFAGKMPQTRVSTLIKHRPLHLL